MTLGNRIKQITGTCPVATDNRGYDENKPGEVLQRSVSGQGLLVKWPEKYLRRDFYTKAKIQL